MTSSRILLVFSNVKEPRFFTSVMLHCVLQSLEEDSYYYSSKTIGDKKLNSLSFLDTLSRIHLYQDFLQAWELPSCLKKQTFRIIWLLSRINNSIKKYLLRFKIWFFDSLFLVPFSVGHLFDSHLPVPFSVVHLQRKAVHEQNLRLSRSVVIVC